MPFIAAKCKQCGHNMQVDESLERGFCPACGTPYVKEDVVNNYNTYNTTNYQIEHADVVISDNGSVEKRLENAEVFLTVHHDYFKAKTLFKSVTDDEPADYRGWWGLVRAVTYDLNFQKYIDYEIAHYSDIYTSPYESPFDYELKEILKSVPLEIRTFAERAISVAPKKNKDIIQLQWERFSKNYILYAKQKTETANIQKRKKDRQRERDRERSAQLSALNQDLYNTKKQMTEFDSQIKKEKERLSIFKNQDMSTAVSIAIVSLFLGKR